LSSSKLTGFVFGDRMAVRFRDLIDDPRQPTIPHEEGGHGPVTVAREGDPLAGREGQSARPSLLSHHRASGRLLSLEGR